MLSHLSPNTAPPPMSAPRIAPYWTRFPSFFLYPLSGEPLLACVGIALIATAAQLLPPLQILVFAGTVRYGFLVLERTARGHIDDRMVLFNSHHGGKHLPWKQVAVVVIGAIVVGMTAGVAGRNAAMLVLVLLGLLWPANTMVLAVTNDMGESINPTRLWQVASRIGMPYLGLCGCLLLLFFGSGQLLSHLAPVVPHALFPTIAGFVAAAFTIAMYRMMGYVLYEYHEELDIDVHVGFERQADHLPVPDAKAARAARIATLLREGRGDEALQEARAAVSNAPEDHDARLRLHKLLLALPNEEAALAAHARGWLPTLLRSGRAALATEVLEAVQKHDPAFAPADAGDILPLATAAFDARRFDTAARLLRGFDQRHPGHRDTASVYLLGARLLIEHRRDEAQAERVLTALRSRFPDHPASSEAEKLLGLIARLRAAG